MSQSAQISLKQDADRNLETKEGRRSFFSAITSIWLGTTLEYVDFALYGLAAGLVFSEVFFPEQTPLVALLSSFATYAVGFLARPVGAIVLGRLVRDPGGVAVALVTEVDNDKLIGILARGLQ